MTGGTAPLRSATSTSFPARASGAGDTTTSTGRKVGAGLDSEPELRLDFRYNQNWNVLSKKPCLAQNSFCCRPDARKLLDQLQPLFRTMSSHGPEHFAWPVVFKAPLAGRLHTARVWDAASRKPLATPLRPSDAVYSAAFSPDGTRVVTAQRRQQFGMAGPPLGAAEQAPSGSGLWPRVGPRRAPDLLTYLHE